MQKASRHTKQPGRTKPLKAYNCPPVPSHMPIFSPFRSTPLPLSITAKVASTAACSETDSSRAASQYISHPLLSPIFSPALSLSPSLIPSPSLHLENLPLQQPVGNLLNQTWQPTIPSPTILPPYLPPSLPPSLPHAPLSLPLPHSLYLECLPRQLAAPPLTPPDLTAC